MFAKGEENQIRSEFPGINGIIARTEFVATVVLPVGFGIGLAGRSHCTRLNFRVAPVIWRPSNRVTNFHIVVGQGSSTAKDFVIPIKNLDSVAEPKARSIR